MMENLRSQAGKLAYVVLGTIVILAAFLFLLIPRWQAATIQQTEMANHLPKPGR